ncbi:MAG: hypothetical protein ACYDDE_03995 [bacterium]
MKSKKIIVLSIFLFVFSLILTGCHNNSSKPQKLVGKSKTFIISTLSFIPGRNISKTDGFYCGFFIYGGTPKNYTARFEGAIAGITVKGKKMGADAFINMKISQSTADLQGSKWNSSIINVCGDFVKF